jgi:glutathione S-transferase
VRSLVALPYSPWSIKARWSLDHHGIEYRFEPYLPMIGEPLLRARLGFPRGMITVPVLIDRPAIVRESLAIARHADALASAGARSREPLIPAEHDRAIVEWNGLSDVIATAGRALTSPRLAESPEALVDSMPRWIPGPLRGVSIPLAEATVRYLIRKHSIREDEMQAHRRTIEFALRKLREALERGDHLVGGALSYADIAMVSALQFVSATGKLAPMGPASLAVWHDNVLASAHGDVLAWRDRMVERHFTPPGRGSARHA